MAYLAAQEEVEVGANGEEVEVGADGEEVPSAAPTPSPTSPASSPSIVLVVDWKQKFLPPNFCEGVI